MHVSSSWFSFNRPFFKEITFRLHLQYKQGLELAAAVHNKLGLAKSEMADMILTSTSDRPKVLWAYNYYGTWYPTLDHNNYKGELTAAAGGEMIGLGQLGSAATTNEYGGMGNDDFKELAAQADVIM